MYLLSSETAELAYPVELAYLLVPSYQVVALRLGAYLSYPYLALEHFILSHIFFLFEIQTAETFRFKCKL